MGYILKASNAKGESGLNRYISMLAGNTNTPVINDTGAMFPIAMVNVGSAGASYIEFTSIPQTYKHLQIRAIAQKTSTGANENYVLQLNGTTASSSYKNHQLLGNGSAASAYSSSLTTAIAVGDITSSGTNANVFGASITDILDYADNNKLKTIRTLRGYDANGSGYILLSSGLYLTNTNAITSIKLFPEVNSFAQYSQFALYGIKG